MKSFSSSPSEVEVSTVLEVSLYDVDVVSLSGSAAVDWRFLFLGPLTAGEKQSEYLAKFQRGNVTGKPLYLPAAAAPEERFHGPGVPGVVCLCVPDGPGVGSEMCK